MTVKEFFDLDVRFHAAEDQMSDLIAMVLGCDWVDGTVTDISYDYYDSSFELHGVANDFRATLAATYGLREMGFQFWFNHVDGNGDTLLLWWCVQEGCSREIYLT